MSAWLELDPDDLAIWLAGKVRREWTPVLVRLLRLARE